MLSFILQSGPNYRIRNTPKIVEIKLEFPRTSQTFYISGIVWKTHRKPWKFPKLLGQPLTAMLKVLENYQIHIQIFKVLIALTFCLLSLFFTYQ